MDLTALPFNQLIGLLAGDAASGELAALPASVRYTNHLGTVHAAALLAVAEAGSAAALLQELGETDGFVPVVRRLDSKFRNAARGRVAARLTGDPADLKRQAEPLAARGRALVAVPIEVVDEQGTVALTAVVEWFIRRARDASSG